MIKNLMIKIINTFLKPGYGIFLLLYNEGLKSSTAAIN